MAVDPLRRAASAAICLLATLALLPGAEPPWRRDADEAIAAARGKPLVLIFTAPWCGWCHRLTDELIADPVALATLRSVQTIEVDIDRHPLVARRLGVSSLPTVVCIDARGLIVAEQVGYVPVAKLLPALQQVASGVTAKPGAKAELWSATAWEEATPFELLAALGTGAPEDRLAVRRALVARPQLDLEPLWSVLDDPALARRIDAAAVLAGRIGSFDAYDPFTVGPARRAALVAWRQRTPASR